MLWFWLRSKIKHIVTPDLMYTRKKERERSSHDANDHSSFSYLTYRMTAALIDVDAFMYEIACVCVEKKWLFMGVAVIWIWYWYIHAPLTAVGFFSFSSLLKLRGSILRLFPQSPFQIQTFCVVFYLFMLDSDQKTKCFTLRWFIFNENAWIFVEIDLHYFRLIIIVEFIDFKRYYFVASGFNMLDGW